MNNSSFMNTTDAVPEGQTDQGLTLFAKVTISIQIIVMLIIIPANTLVILAIVKCRSLQDTTAIFVANLAISDLITGVSIPFQIAFFFNPYMEENKHMCLLRYLVITFACNASIYSLMCTVVDRLVAITYPLRYYSIMTRKVAYGMVITIWLIDLMFQSVPLLGANNWDTVPFCLYELVMDKWYRMANYSSGLLFGFAMFCIYIRIFIIVRRHVLRIESELVQQSVDVHDGRKSKHMNTVVAMVVLFFHVSWLPFFITQMTMLDAKDVTRNKVIIANFCVFGGLFNSVINPFIYAWKNKHYRKAFKKILCMSSSQDEITNISSTC